MDIEGIKKKLTENMKEADADYINYPENGEYPEGYASGCRYAIELLEDLQEKKVIIPQFIADWIENDLDYVGKEPVNIVRGAVEDGDCGPRGEWLDSIDNQKLFLNAIANGYEVEKGKLYRVKIDNKLYFQRSNCNEVVFLIDDSLGVKESSPVFTREEGNKILETLDVESGQLEEVESDD